MNNTDMPRSETSADEANLVTEVMRLHARVGDGLNEAEFTELLKIKLPAPANGFGVLCFSGGCVTFSVPEQNVGGWYGTACTIASGKETLANQIANEHGLVLCEPPDKLVYGAPGPGVHRHLEFTNRRHTIAVAHPLYLKIRVGCGGEHDDLPVESEAAIRQYGRLFSDLSQLYR